MKTPNTRPERASRDVTLLFLAAGLALAPACGGGGGGGGGGPGPGNAELEAALDDLGVDTRQTAREDEEGDPLPASYSPFGTTWELAKTNELLLVGVNVNATGKPFSLVDVTSDTGNPALEVLHAKSETEASWAREARQPRALPGTLRAASAADVDGDGLEEAVIVYQDDLETRVVTVEDEPAGFTTVDDFLTLESGVTNVALRAGDLDGDGRDELAVGLSAGGPGGTGELLVARRTAQDFTVLAQHRRSFAPTLAGSTLWLQLAAGNIDHDPADELVVVVNEEFRDFQGNPSSNARFHVLDDLDAGLAQLLSGPVQGRDQANTLRTAVVATPAIGDVDGDGVGEVLLGGLTAYARFCNSASYFLLALEDADRGLAPVAGRSFTHFYDDCDSPADPQVRTVHLSALDIDGDGRDEVQANLFVFQDFVEAAPWTEVPGWRLPESAFFRQNDFGHLDLNTSCVVAGDFTGDDREDIAVYRQDTTEIGIYGVLQTSPGVTTKARSVPVAFHNAQQPVNPVLVALNTDTDSPVLRYDEGRYQLVFSEPIVIAALAAAPSKNGIGQNVGACRTTFGNTESTGAESERTVSVTASSTVGYGVGIDLEITQAALELRATARVAASRMTSHAYTLSKTILFTSGPTEDLVVFTTVPMDQYTYTILSHPDPELVGKPLVVSLPREPITLQAERGFFNRSLPARFLGVDERVFRHVIGDPASYPTRAEKQDLLARNGSDLAVGPISVGQGSGETEVTLEVGEEFGQGGSVELGFEVELEFTGTIGGVGVSKNYISGFSVGASLTDTLRVTSGRSTTYTGVVGAIDAANFAANRYSFGLFTYVHHDPATGREFEVLHYWTE